MVDVFQEVDCVGNRFLSSKMIWEDDPNIVEWIRYNVDKEPFQVVGVGDGLAGLARIRKIPPDLLLSDLMLPHLSSLAICQEIRRDKTLDCS